MVKEEKKPYGYIYKATNTINGKVYIGKTEKTIEKRWNGHLKEARALERLREAFPNEKISGSHLNNAIIKYGGGVFSLNQEDIADNIEELNEKEKYYIKEYDSMNPDKGYNMTEGGEGGRFRPEVIEKLRKIGLEQAKDPEWHEKVSKGVSAKYQNDPEYLEKQTQERRERAKNPEWIEKMTKINQEKGKDPKFRETVSKAITDKYQKDPEYKEKQTQERRERAMKPEWIEKMTKINQERAKDPDWREKMREIGKQYRKEISDKQQFLNDIKNNIPKKELVEKYGMGGKTMNKRIEEMLGENGVKNYTDAKEYLKDKDLDEILNDIKEREAEERGDKSEDEENTEEPEEIDKEPSEDRDSPQEKDEELGEEDEEEEAEGEKEKSIEEEKGEKSEEPSEEQVPEPIEPSIDAPTDESHDHQETQTEKSSDNLSSEPLEKPPQGIILVPLDPTEQENENQIERKEWDASRDKKDEKHNLTSGREYDGNKLSTDYSGIDQTKTDEEEDFKGIDEYDNDTDKDYNKLDDITKEKGSDFDGIDSPQEKRDKDYDNIDEEYPEGSVESGGGP